MLKTWWMKRTADNQPRGMVRLTDSLYLLSGRKPMDRAARLKGRAPWSGRDPFRVSGFVKVEDGRMSQEGVTLWLKWSFCVVGGRMPRDRRSGGNDGELLACGFLTCAQQEVEVFFLFGRSGHDGTRSRS